MQVGADRGSLSMRCRGQERSLMKLGRHTLLVLCAAAASAGCHAAGSSNLTRPSPIATRTTSEASELIAEHNRNAEKIETLKAKTSITISSRRMPGAGVKGNLVLERPRNFKLVLSTTMTDVADIGSNDQEFWFWVQDSPEKAIYYCYYDEQGTSPLATSLQPDWIVEALGLRVISEEDIAEIKVRPGKDPGTLVLTQRPRRGAGGLSFVRETVVTESNHRIAAHRVYSGDGKTLLAQATVLDGYLEVGLPATDTAARVDTAILPRRLKLEWFQEKLALDVTLKDPKVNPAINAEQRALLFVEPDVKGYARRSLSDRPGLADGPSIRETRPIPPSPSGIRLGEPTPLGADDSARSTTDPVALTADLPGAPRLSDQIVRPTIPQAPEPAQPRTGGGWRNASAYGVER